jgi:hypothetical protein
LIKSGGIQIVIKKREKRRQRKFRREMREIMKFDVNTKLFR